MACAVSKLSWVFEYNACMFTITKHILKSFIYSLYLGIAAVRESFLQYFQWEEGLFERTCHSLLRILLHWNHSLSLNTFEEKSAFWVSCYPNSFLWLVSHRKGKWAYPQQCIQLCWKPYYFPFLPSLVFCLNISNWIIIMKI